MLYLCSVRTFLTYHFELFHYMQRLLGKYGSLISVISIVVLFVYLLATPSKSAKGGKKKR